MVIAMVAMLLGPATARGQSLQSRVDRIIRGMDLGDATFGLLIVDLDSGQRLAERNPERALIPASNMKLLTSAAALQTLGPDYVLRTQLLRDGDRLIVRGEGDPGFGDPVLLEHHGLTPSDLLRRWAEAAKRTGRERFAEIVVEDRVLDNEFVHPRWPADQLNKWYCAQVATINFNDNVIDVYANPTEPGQPPIVTVEPRLAAINPRNIAQTGDRNAFWASRTPGTNRIQFRGQVRHALDSPIHVTIHDPPMFFGRTLRRWLRAEGMDVEDVRRIGSEEVLPEGELLAAVQTTLPTLLLRCNRNSQNLFAEALFKHLGHELTGQAGSWENGAAAIRRFLAEAVGTDAAKVVIDDGSGMSRENRVSPAVLIELLTYMHKQEAADLYRLSLATPGEDGTLKSRFDEFELAGSLRAKSGYLNRVICLSGYLMRDDGPDAAFAMLLNDYRGGPYKAKDIMERIIAELDEVMAERMTASLGG